MKKDIKFNHEILKLAERITRVEVEKNVSGQGVYCTGIFHQPKRPQN